MNIIKNVVSSVIGGRGNKRKETVNINGMDFSSTGDVSISIKNGVVTVNGQEVNGDMDLEGVWVEVNITGNVKEYKGDAQTVTIEGNVEGNVGAGQRVEISGDVGGDVSAGQRVECGNVGRDVEAGQRVECGDIQGNVDAGQNITCGNVAGSVDAGQSVKMRK